MPKNQLIPHIPCRLALVATLTLLGLAAPAVQAQYVISNLVSFDGTNDSRPAGQLLQATDGNFYGTSQFGGPDSDGAIFQLTLGGSFTNLAFFNGPNGENPGSGLIQGSDGNFYGTTAHGGAYTNLSDAIGIVGYGTVFQLNATNFQLTTLDSFTGTNGGTPNGLVETTPGVFFGTATFGGTNVQLLGPTDGTVYMIDINGFITNALSLGDTNGYSPAASLIPGGNGNLYGTTSYGGTNEEGTIFSLDTNDVLTSLFSFDNTNGTGPGMILLATDGNFYGVTLNGGAYGLGTIFQLTPSNVLNTIATFNGTNGTTPTTLIQATDGNLYGTTTQGGDYDSGVIFEITTNGLATLYSFTGGSDGDSPISLIQATDGNFYGATSFGGDYGRGNIFKFTVVPVPVLQIAGTPTNSVTLTWNAAAGVTYEVQYINDLTLTNWTDLESVTATNNIATASDSVGPDVQRLYRVIAELVPSPGD